MNLRKYHFFIIFLFIFICSCATSVKENKEIDLWSDDPLKKNEIIEQIKIRENSINSTQQKIQKLQNYNQKFRPQLNDDSFYHRDTAVLQRIIAKNNEIISEYKILISRLNKEIQILKRKFK